MRIFRKLKQRKTRHRRMSLKQFKNELLQTARDEGIVSALEYGVMEVLRDHPKLTGVVLGAYSSLASYKEAVSIPAGAGKSCVVTRDNTRDDFYTEVVKEHLPRDVCFGGSLDDELIFNLSFEKPRNNICLPPGVPRTLMTNFSKDKRVISYMSWQLGWTEDKTREKLSQYGALDDKGNIDFWRLGDWFRTAEILVDPSAPIVKNNSGVEITFPLKKGKINLNYDPSERRATVGMEYKF